MSETTQIHPEKVRAYLATDYRLGHSNQDIVVTIGKHSEHLATLFADSGVVIPPISTDPKSRTVMQLWPNAASG